MANIKDVARVAGVSIATVSRVVNETGYVSPELEGRVRAAITTLGYKPNAMARHLRRSESLTLGVLIPDSSNPFFSEIAKGVEDVCFDRGYTVVLCNTDENTDKASIYFSTLFQHRVAGFIVVSTADLAPHLQQLLDEGYPIVLADRPVPEVATDSVVSDNYGGAVQAVQHLIDRGHRRIGFIVGESPLYTIKSRWQGAVDTLTRAGLPLDESLLCRRADFLPHSGYEGAASLLSMPDPPSAIFAFNDLMAFGVLSYAQKHGIEVPRELSVVGFDDTMMASYSAPTLTTIAQPKYDLGRMVAEILLRRIAGDEQPPVHMVLPTRLVVRESTSAPGEPGKEGGRKA